MNTLQLTVTLWSYKREFYAVILTILFILSLPIIGVVVVTHAGIQVISDTLISRDPTTQSIQILNPKDGSVLKDITGTYVWPVQGVVTLNFGESSMYQPFHAGIDIANPKGYIGDPISAFMDGTVTHVGDLSWGYGRHVIIQHENNISTVYAHLSYVSVSEGQLVKVGDVIGNMGQTGWATGQHLHFEVRVFGVPVNPRVFLEASP